MISPPAEQETRKRMPKPSAQLQRNSKRSSTSQYPSDSADGRPKRVWKACERCRMKKTKCDGESPCKRCRNDGEVCVSGNRKKAEFKPAPRGYAERLENSQQALKSTVLKLYTMLRNGEPWDLGEPSTNDSGQPAIHDIVSKLGCIRDSPDLPTQFFEDPHDYARLRAELQTQEEEDAHMDETKHSTDEDDASFTHSQSLPSPKSESSCHSPPGMAFDSYPTISETDMKKQDFELYKDCRPQPSPLNLSSLSNLEAGNYYPSFYPEHHTSPMDLNSPFTGTFEDAHLVQSSMLGMPDQYMSSQLNLAGLELDVEYYPPSKFPFSGTIQPDMLNDSSTFSDYDQIMDPAPFRASFETLNRSEYP